MPVYLQSSDGSLYKWTRSVAELEERLYDLERRGYAVEVQVL